MNRINKIFLPVYMVFTLLLFNGCDQTDDVAGIFTGRAWKLTEFIDANTNKVFNYWTSEDEKRISYQLKAQPGTFTVTFSGIGDFDVVNGQFSGRGVSTTFSGHWTADGNSTDFRTSNNVSANDTDVLANGFIRGLEKAYKYEGDYDNLYIYFKDGQVEKYLLLHRVN
mgnify:CR=1 FL=1